MEKRVRQGAGKREARAAEIQSKLDLGLDLKSGVGEQGSGARAMR